MSEYKSQARLKAENKLRNKGFDPNTPEFSNLRTNELVRRANKAESADDEKKDKNKNDEKEKNINEKKKSNEKEKNGNEQEKNNETSHLLWNIIDYIGMNLTSE
jgi:hypothetical protein